MAKFIARFDERTTEMLDHLSCSGGRSGGVSKAHVIRRAVALLQRAVEARERGERLTIADAQDRVVKEILL